MFTKLLVGLDGSPPSQVALAQAIQIGQRFQSTIILCHVSPPEVLEHKLFRSLGAPWREGRPDPTLPGSGAASKFAQSLLSDAAGAVMRAGLTADTAFRSGEVVAELQELAGSADALFLGRVGAQGGEDPLGPDTRELIQKALTPVFVCGPTVSPMDRCAVAIDGEAPSMRALALAAQYAEVAAVHLDVIHAAETEAAGSEVLARASVALSETPIRFETHIVLGEIDRAVTEAVRRLGCNALFVGAHRAEGRWLMPSHTEAILRATDLPVIVHNAPARLSARVSASYRRSSS